MGRQVGGQDGATLPVNSRPRSRDVVGFDGYAVREGTLWFL